jgi:hypothetical protein
MTVAVAGCSNFAGRVPSSHVNGHHQHWRSLCAGVGAVHGTASVDRARRCTCCTAPKQRAATASRIDRPAGHSRSVPRRRTCCSDTFGPGRASVARTRVQRCGRRHLRVPACSGVGELMSDRVCKLSQFPSHPVPGVPLASRWARWWPSPAAKAASARPSSLPTWRLRLAKLRHSGCWCSTPTLGLANLDVVLQPVPEGHAARRVHRQGHARRSHRPRTRRVLRAAGRLRHGRVFPPVRRRSGPIFCASSSGLMPRLRRRAARHRRRHLGRGAVRRVSGLGGACRGHARAHLVHRCLRHHQGAGGPAASRQNIHMVINQTARHRRWPRHHRFSCSRCWTASSSPSPSRGAPSN